MNTDLTCWICNSSNLEVAKKSDMNKVKSNKGFVISGTDYGITGELHICTNCGFIQWSEMSNVLDFYENTIEDPIYESLRNGRATQNKKILEVIKKYKISGKLLDVGAGSGILVEQAINKGYIAEGIEPSEWFQKKAKELNLPVHLGSLPHPEIKGPYDIVTIIDVLEHIPNPVDILRETVKIVEKNGIVVAVTPDCNSLPAKICGWKWWNFKPGHIGYFNKKTLDLAFTLAGFRKIYQGYRPPIHYPLGFILEKIICYLPKAIQFHVPPLLHKLIIPLDLRDSVLGIYTLT